MSTPQQPVNPQGVAFTNKTVPAPPREVSSAQPKMPPPPPVVEVEDAFVPDSEIQAKPLRDPDFINMKPKNKSLAFFWGNRAVGDKESKMRFNQLQAKGFLPAKPQDIEGWDADPDKSLVPDSLVHEGRVIFGDLILMKIPRVDYIGQQKWNVATAVGRMAKRGIVATVDKGQGGPKELSKTPDDGGRITLGSVDEVTRNPRTAAKVNFYAPNQQDAELLTGAKTDKTKDL